MADETLLDSLREELAQASDLRLGLMGDDDALVAPIPELAAPIVEPTHLAGDVAVDESHEVAQLFRALGHDEHVVVIREEGEGAEVDLGAPLGPSQNAKDGPIHFVGRSEQIAPLKGTSRDLDQAVFDQPSEFSQRCWLPLAPEDEKETDHLALASRAKIPVFRASIRDEEGGSSPSVPLLPG